MRLISLPDTRTHASQVPSAPATGKQTAARHIPSARRQHFRGKSVNFTRFSCSRLVQRTALTCLDRCLAYCFFTHHGVQYTRSTQRHGHTCFYVEPTGSSAACYEFQGAMPATEAYASKLRFPLSAGRVWKPAL